MHTIAPASPSGASLPRKTRPAIPCRWRRFGAAGAGGPVDVQATLFCPAFTVDSNGTGAGLCAIYSYP